eukprot:618671-Pyramimonas_sp.AAC.1
MAPDILGVGSETRLHQGQIEHVVGAFCNLAHVSGAAFHERGLFFWHPLHVGVAYHQIAFQAELH